MHFISNKISVGKTKTFEDICKDYLSVKEDASVKTASAEEAVVKVAEADEAEGSGQLEVEPLHQEGESTNQDSVAGGKCSCDGEKEAGSAPMKAADEEGESSGQPEAEGKEELNNDPYDDPKVTADADATVKEAEAKCEECDCDPCECKDVTCAETDEEEAEGEEKEASAEETVKVAFKKIANLTSEEKARLGKFWKNIYPEDFVNAMLADK